MFIYSNTNKRYHTLDYYLKNKFGCKVCKISLDAGFTCPNIDGTKGIGGCTYCSKRGSGDFAADKLLPIKKQFEYGKELIKNKWKNTKYIAYFQAHTNTYAPLDKLKQLFEETLEFDDVVGISIATRADCLSEETLNYLEELNQKTYLTVELGLQTIYDKTGEYINRCHSYNDFLQGFYKLKKRKIRVCVHIINGLPFEDYDMMINTAKTLSQLDLDAVKIHSLHIIKDTKMAFDYEKSPFYVLSQEEYVSIVCDQIEMFNENVVIERITGDGVQSDVIAPKWSNNKKSVMNSIDKELTRRNTFQGIKYKKD